MKTIEQETSNFVHKKINSIPEEHIKTLPKSFVMAALIDGFNEGVKFAQRWIPVEEELPTEFEKQILVKNEQYNFVDLRFFNHQKQFNLLCEIHRYTHWRPISFL